MDHLILQFNLPNRQKSVYNYGRIKKFKFFFNFKEMVLDIKTYILNWRE